ncbi:hypothetical protein [Xenorhabdus hominickii]|uniref:Transposase n=1 Tax=Xenorhabdus hominickii TaxID=351679 RepID=A0A2G0Q9W9_XENHO|nr:hypothetical protein [Xenorhabdus hominickii]PHM56011.1 hypothetical protein Xhom_01474 [Xenorhabdus hominickii]
MRYICALLEADIPGHLTHRLEMKVSRYSTGYLHNRAEHSLSDAERDRFHWSPLH